MATFFGPENYDSALSAIVLLTILVFFMIVAVTFSTIRFLFRPKKENQIAVLKNTENDFWFEWRERNKRGECGECGLPFADHNPHWGGGMCRYCWIRNDA